MRKIIFFLLLFLNLHAFAQNNAGNYIDSLKNFRQHYIATHDIIKGADTAFLRFFPIDSNYRVTATFGRIHDEIGFGMKTRAGGTARHFKYGTATFFLNNKEYHLFIYQSEYVMKMKGYEDYLFLPFTDSTNGFDSFGGGRYIDLATGNIKNNQVELDFNKAYNPLCAYKEGYACPIPPRENDLATAINAGEKAYGKPIQ